MGSIQSMASLAIGCCLAAAPTLASTRQAIEDHRQIMLVVGYVAVGGVCLKQ